MMIRSFLSPTAFGLLLALWFSAQQVMAQQPGCSYDGVRVSNNQLLACDTEDGDGREVPITPPPPSALRQAQDEAVRGRITTKRPETWPVRAILWNGLVSEGASWAEFDSRGNITKSNFAAPNSYLAEYLRQDAPVWLGAQHVYAAVEPGAQIDMDSTSRTTFVVSGKQVCPARPLSTAYAYYRRQDDSAVYLSGNCGKAVQRRIATGDFRAYPEDLEEAPESPGQNPKYWMIQYFNDPVTPLTDAAGTCVRYCDAKARAVVTLDEKAHPVPDASVVSPALDLGPPPRSALRQLPVQDRPQADPEEVQPAEWPVRALFNSRAGIFEFDSKGNLLNASGKTNIRTVEVRFGGPQGASLWAGNQNVYWLLAPGTLSEIDSASAATTGIVVTGKQACPTQLVAEAFGILHEHGSPYLNGSCAKAVKRNVGQGEFWIYPEESKAEHPQYWVVQYFHEPRTPIIDAEGQCWLYCNKAAQGK